MEGKGNFLICGEKKKTTPKYLSDFKCGVEAQEIDQSWYVFSCKEASEAVSDGDVMKGKNKCISQTYAGGEMGDRG